MRHGGGAIGIQRRCRTRPAPRRTPQYPHRQCHRCRSSRHPSCVVLFLIVRTIPSWPGFMAPENMLSARVVILLCSAIGAPVWSTSSGAKTPICTSSHLSPSRMSSPALPWMQVAAVTAEDDVAGDEGGDTGAQHLLQAADQGDALVVEGAALIAFRAALGRRQPFFGQRHWRPSGRR